MGNGRKIIFDYAEQLISAWIQLASATKYVCDLEVSRSTLKGKNLTSIIALWGYFPDSRIIKQCHTMICNDRMKYVPPLKKTLFYPVLIV
jgi:hypothetical protein